jgi:hypothetical protein
LIVRAGLLVVAQLTGLTSSQAFYLGVVPEDSDDLALVQELHLLGREVGEAEG